MGKGKVAKDRTAWKERACGPIPHLGIIMMTRLWQLNCPLSTVQNFL